MTNWVLHPDTLGSTVLAGNMFLLLTVTADLMTHPTLAAFISWSHFSTPLLTFCFVLLYCIVACFVSHVPKETRIVSG